MRSESREGQRPEPTLLLVAGGRVLDPSQGLDDIGDVLIVDGKVEHSGSVVRRRAPRR